MEVWVEDNKIMIPVIGTRFGIRKVKSGKAQDLKIVGGNEPNTFVVLFDEDDVDFEITVNNKCNGRGMRYTVVINKDKAIFFPKQHCNHNLQTMQSNGRKFHFLSQQTEEGKRVVQDIADKYNMSYDEAAITCSRIHFEVDIEEMSSKSYLGTFDTRKGFYRSFHLKPESADKKPNSSQLNLNANSDANSSSSSSEFGETIAYRARGVICFTGKSDQVFSRRYEIFVKDKQLNINPFILELRMKD